MLHLAYRSVGLVAALFLHPAVALPVGATLPFVGLSGRELQHRAENPEHVVLADCRDPKAVVSSQIAYFEGEPGKTPKDVAVVHTNPGEAALWINANTSGLFTDTGVTFVATIGPKVADGDFAGTGHNGYGSFSCWQNYHKDLYSYGGTTCSQVYFCNHEPVPSNLPTPINPPSDGLTVSTQATPTATTSGTVSTGSDPAASPASSGGGLSQGALIGIIVGVVGTLAVAAVGLLLWTWLRYKNQQPPSHSGRSRGCCGILARREFQQPPPDNFMPAHAIPARTSLSIHEVKGGPGTYEMGGQWYRAEMAEDHGKYELDGTNKFDRDLDVDKKLALPEGMVYARSPERSKENGALDISPSTPATSTTAVSEQKVWVPGL